MFDYRVLSKIHWGCYIIHSIYMYSLSKIQKILDFKIHLDLKILSVFFYFLSFFLFFVSEKKKHWDSGVKWYIRIITAHPRWDQNSKQEGKSCFPVLSPMSFSPHYSHPMELLLFDRLTQEMADLRERQTGRERAPGAGWEGQRVELPVGVGGECCIGSIAEPPELQPQNCPHSAGLHPLRASASKKTPSKTRALCH